MGTTNFQAGISNQYTIFSSNTASVSVPVVPQKKTNATVNVPAKGTNAREVLARAPLPDVLINGQFKKATIVVDLSKNVLYKYDQKGNPEMAYLIASGKKSTPTETGIRVISHVETYPYKGAPATTQRRKTPGAFGPKILILRKVNPKDGSTSETGEFIHGNSDASSIGKYASKGCMRMDNEVIKLLAKQVESGDIVLITR